MTHGIHGNRACGSELLQNWYRAANFEPHSSHQLERAQSGPAFGHGLRCDRLRSAGHPCILALRTASAGSGFLCSRYLQTYIYIYRNAYESKEMHTNLKKCIEMYSNIIYIYHRTCAKCPVFCLAQKGLSDLLCSRKMNEWMGLPTSSDNNFSKMRMFGERSHKTSSPALNSCESK